MLARAELKGTESCLLFLACCMQCCETGQGCLCLHARGHTVFLSWLLRQLVVLLPLPPLLAAVIMCVMQYPVTAASLGAVVLIGRIGYCEVSRRHRVGGGEGQEGRQAHTEERRGAAVAPHQLMCRLQRQTCTGTGIHTVPAHWCQQWC